MKHILNVARMGNPVLREVAEPVDPASIATAEFQDFIDSMLLTMHEYDGVGLAAPQVHVSQRVVVFHEHADLETVDGRPITVLVNPVIEILSEETESMWEGCLSLPGLRGQVSRPSHIRVRGLDRSGSEVELELRDFDAVVTQHECDHLDGRLFIDRVEDTRELAFEREFERYWAEPIELDDDEGELDAEDGEVPGEE
jgi:peptide deformylase